MNKKIERFKDLEVWKKAHQFVSVDLGYLEDNKDSICLVEEIGRMLYGLIKSIQ
jgi:hypothetical protein